MKSTRDQDLGELEEARDRGSKRAGEMLNKIYRQAHDDTLELYRHELIEATRRNDLKQINRLEMIIREYSRQRNL